ncbi:MULTISPECIES: XRE family transcriptional regulator [unclassified Streptomyces]|uniref:helix-turn-helix domain-containing protein n=1 Tax=unclassified Streptomyces TaxID=2593676 RepID=UPI002254D20C|nr:MULTISPECIES: XRE family transcriptional regulator [unclassified Streptomyces]MCX5055519.1 XRE family transcriptional regulator [Streptomyces sp. NBC_00452]MCX5286583.1 XRE family transcriptional regulator [Streptomyces sp. NBC_00183]
MTEVVRGESGTPTDARQLLLAEMRRMKDASGLSFGRLASRTHYSRSSWERFLNGEQLPTRVAMEQLAAAVGEESTALLALWDTLDTTSRELGETRQDALPPKDDTWAPVAPAGSRGGGNRWLRRALPLCYVASGALLGALGTALFTDDGHPAAAAPRTSPTRELAAPVAATASRPGCQGDSCLEAEPQAKNCQWDARTAHETWLRGLQIQLRYSPSCKAAWGRIENGTIGDSVSITDRWGRTEDATIRVGTDTYTRMLSTASAPASTITICGRIPSQHDQECTPTDKPPAP